MSFLSMVILNGCAEQANAPAAGNDESATSMEQSLDTATPAGDAMAGDTTAETAALAENGDEQNVGDADVAEDETAATDEPFDQLAPPKAGDKIAVIETDFGTIKARLFPGLVPEMVKNFETHANNNMYNGVPFHRVVKDFMIQTGDFQNQNGTGGYSYKGPGTKLDDEIAPELKHLYGTLSMANAGPDTNGSQFFIVTNRQGTSFLDGGYTIFGQVYEGMDVALKIADLQKPGTEQPSQVVTMTNVTIETAE